MALIVVGASAWYVIPLVLSPLPNPTQEANGLFVVYRLIQATIVFYCVSRVEFDVGRLHALRRLLTFTIVVAAATIALTYAGLVSTSAFSGWLPSGRVAGAWIPFNSANLPGSGTLGYNHGFTSLLLLVLLGLRLHLSEKPGRVEYFIIAVVITSIFLTGARDGLAVSVVFVAVYLSRRPIVLVSAAVVSILAVGVLFTTETSPNSSLASTLTRASAIAQPFSGDSLSGRLVIWSDHLAYLTDDTVHLILGSGVGSAWLDTVNGGPDDAHMVYLEVLLEAGIAGAAVFVAWGIGVVRALRRAEGGWGPFAVATVMLLVSGVTQETFYPVASSQHFLAMFLCAAAIVLRNSPTTVTIGNRGRDTGSTASTLRAAEGLAASQTVFDER